MLLFTSNLMVSWGLLLVINICSEFKQVKSTPPTKEEAIIRGRQRFGGFDNAKDYEYEIETGHKRNDVDKFKRQQGCLCVDHFYDPHCGSNMKTYDNGCYFLCGQQREPNLKLLRWGSCDDPAEEKSQESNSFRNDDVEVDYDYETNIG